MMMTERTVRRKSKNSNAINCESRGLLASARDVLAVVLRFLACRRPDEPHC